MCVCVCVRACVRVRDKYTLHTQFYVNKNFILDAINRLTALVQNNK